MARNDTYLLIDNKWVDGDPVRLLDYFKILYSRRCWRLIQNIRPYAKEEGPVLYHLTCRRVTTCLPRVGKAECNECGRPIPEDMVTLYTLHNLDKINEIDYFCHHHSHGYGERAR